MNFVEQPIRRDLSDGTSGRDYRERPNAARKWPIHYDSVGLLAIIADIATIALISIFCGLYHLQGLEPSSAIGKSLGSAIVVSALFISLMKIRGMAVSSRSRTRQFRPRYLTLRRKARRTAGCGYPAVALRRRPRDVTSACYNRQEFVDDPGGRRPLRNEQPVDLPRVALTQQSTTGDAPIHLVARTPLIGLALAAVAGAVVQRIMPANVTTDAWS